MSRMLLMTAVIAQLALPAGADRIELKGEAAIIGQILAEKPDHVVVDVGYTVLLVPRSQILDISAGSGSPASEPAVELSTADTASASARFYNTNTGGAKARTVRDLVSLLGEGVVQVRTPGGLGSGFIINDEGFLITNFHVIEGETQISVEVYWQTGGQLERKTYKQVRIVAMNKFKDLALLKIEDEDAPPFRFVRLGDADELAVGERVFAIGSPLGLERTVTEGIVSTKTREMMGELYLQTTAQINPGNSGGPLFNLKGEVVGVTNMKINFGEGLGFAIPVEALKFFLDHRDAYAYSTDNPSNPFRYLEPPSRTRQEASTKN
ncbi:MAG: trypsin-like peptidase domain-containing protein [Verrucomicrobia bacterium]|nr:trypsin-like peptidase domain-containing protein [Verrucomicrobiota bacterium]